MTVIRNILKHLGYDIEIRRIGHTHSKPVLLELRSSKWFILATVTTATFTDIFLYGVIVPVIPYAITERAGIPADKIQYWTSVLLSVYGGALLAASQPWGWIADRWSDRRTPMLFGLFVLTVATAMMAVGSSLALLIVGRILQGLSGAIVWISSLALLCDTVGSKNIGQFMGYVGASLSVALLISPLLGGVVNVKGGYDAVFGMCWGCIGMDIVLRLLMIEKKVAAKYLGVERAWASTMALPRDEEAPQEPPVIPRIDTGSPLPWSAEMQSAYPGSPSPTERASTLVNSPSDFEKDFRLSSLQQPPAAAVTVIPNHNIAEKPLPIIPLAADAAVRPSPRRTPVLPSPSVSWHSRLSRAPLVILLRSPRMAAAMWGNLVQAILLTAFDATLPLHVRQLFGWSSLGAGLIFLPMTIPSLLGPLVGLWVDRNGESFFQLFLSSLKFSLRSLHSRVPLDEQHHFHSAAVVVVNAAVCLTSVCIRQLLSHTPAPPR